MANINELLERAASLRDETALNSISPERAGGIMYDTLIALNELWLQQGAALLISKIYASVAAMEADTAPVSDLTGQPLRPGQIVVIASSDSDNGTVYRYNGTESPSWIAVGKIGNLEPVDSLDSDSTSLPLAAHQGKVLDGKVSQLGQKTQIADFNSKYCVRRSLLKDFGNYGYNYETGTFSKPNPKNATMTYSFYIGKGNSFYFTDTRYLYNPNYFISEKSPQEDMRDAYDEIDNPLHIFVAKEDYVFLCLVGADGEDIDVSQLDITINILDTNPINYGAVYDGITDCSEAIQAVLNIGGTIRFEGNGIALIGNTLKINKSNTHIIADKTFKFFLADGVDAPLIQTTGADYKWDDNRAGTNLLDNISIRGGYWDFNADNQAEISGKDIHWQSGMLIVDVSNFHMEGCYLYHSKHFAFNGAGLDKAVFKNITGNNFGGYSNDILHFNGHNYDIDIDTVIATANDDIIAINICGDYNTLQSKEWQVRRGDAKRISIKNIYGNGAFRAIRLMSGYNDNEQLHDVIIDGVYGNYNYYGVINIGPWRESSVFGNIVIKNINAMTYDISGEERKSIIDINNGFNYDLEGQELSCKISSLSIDNISVNNTSLLKNQLLWIINGNDVIDSCIINNVIVSFESGIDMSEYSFIKVGGNYADSALIKNLCINNVIIPDSLEEGKRYNYMLFCKVTNLLVSNCVFNGEHKYKDDRLSRVLESNVLYNNSL